MFINREKKSIGLIQTSSRSVNYSHCREIVSQQFSLFGLIKSSSQTVKALLQSKFQFALLSNCFDRYVLRNTVIDEIVYFTKVYLQRQSLKMFLLSRMSRGNLRIAVQLDKTFKRGKGRGNVLIVNSVVSKLWGP